MGISDVVAEIKVRLQTQQRIIGKATDDPDTFTRLSFRAELDALWSAVEALAQVCDGIPADRVTVRDYFGDPRR